MKYVFDIDGTLADLKHRLHFIQPKEGEKKDWDGFFAACVDDAPIPENVRLCQTLIWFDDLPPGQFHYFPPSKIEFWTGRREAERDVTRIWLMQHVSIHTNNCTLKMRKDGDRRQDHVLKMEFIDPLDPPDIIFEDRSTVVQAYRERGLTVFQVAEGDF